MIATTDYTVFPVLYVDGVYQYDSTWTQLTRTLCGIAADRGVAVSACMPTPIELSITFDGEVAPSDVGTVEAAVLSAVNLAASNASLPVRFATDDDALTQPGEVSYANVNATFSVEMLPSKHRPASREKKEEMYGQTSAYQFKVKLLEVRHGALCPPVPRPLPQHLFELEQTCRLHFSLEQPRTPTVERPSSESPWASSTMPRLAVARTPALTSLSHSSLS
mmetsp:Transcript_26355/g.70380  ORF Transcript_26355/g.70380 Transcript_26355/m.70380 type:complete len:221 (-) Transcript_26355:1047-1709(-)